MTRGRRKPPWNRDLINHYLGYTAGKDFYELLSEYQDGLLRDEVINLLGPTARKLAQREGGLRKSRYVKRHGLLYEKKYVRISGKDTYRYKLKDEYMEIIRDYFDSENK